MTNYPTKSVMREAMPFIDNDDYDWRLSKHKNTGAFNGVLVDYAIKKIN